MAELPARAPFSYRDDPAVPAFEDSGPVTVMDGDCALCSFGARMIARFDHQTRFKICPAQTALGTALLGHYDLSPEDPESWLLLYDGRAYASLDAMIRAGALVGGIGHALWPLKALPRAAQDWLYCRIARNRYRLFGRSDICAVPDEKLKARLLLK